MSTTYNAIVGVGIDIYSEFPDIEDTDEMFDMMNGEEPDDYDVYYINDTYYYLKDLNQVEHDYIENISDIKNFDLEQETEVLERLLGKKLNVSLFLLCWSY